MGFSFRKSVKLRDGVKLNISKSGVGISFGVKGFRISTNSKGSTLYAGKRGFSYRKKLPNPPKGIFQAFGDLLKALFQIK